MLIPKEFDVNLDGTVDDNANIRMAKRKDDVEVQLWYRPDGSRYVKVLLRSKMKNKIISSNQMDLDLLNMNKKVAIMGGALAEYQCEAFGDSHNPFEVARATVEAYSEALLDEGLRDSKIFLT